MAAEKVCSVCRQAWPLSCFDRRAASPDGLRAQCKACRSVYRRRQLSGVVRVEPIGKACSGCGEWKLASEFSKRKSRLDGLAPRCRPCHNEAVRANKDVERDRQLHREWVDRNPARAGLLRRRGNLAKYNLTPERYDEILASQQGVCAACGAAPIGNLQVDHDHACCPGKASCGRCVRGLLCGGCNRALAAVGDDPSRLERLSGYLTGRRVLAAEGGDH